jgi:hypothetical protein
MILRLRSEDEYYNCDKWKLLFEIYNNVYDDLDDYYNNDDVDYNDVGVVHDVDLMIMMVMIMMITMMHYSHCTIYHYHNNHHHHLLLF